jgi:hypothetical protein
MDLMNMRNGADSNQLEFHGSETGGTSDALLLQGGGPFVVQVSAGLIEWTNSAIADIEDNSAVWEEWPDGTVVATTSGALDGTAIAMRFTGTGSWSVTCKKPGR